MHKRKSTPWARRRRRLYIVCFVVVLLLSPAVIWRLRLRTEVRQELAAIKAIGVPMTAEEHAAWRAQFPELPPNEAYPKAASALVALPFDGYEKFPSFRTRHSGEDVFAVPYDPATSAAMRQLVELNGETLRLLREGRTQVKTGRVGGLGRGGFTKDFMELCCAQACVAAEAGDGALAAETILDGLAFLKAYYARPWSTSLYSRGDEVGQLMRALASAAARATLPEDKLREMQSLLEAPNWEEELRLSTIDFAATMIQDIYEHQPSEPPARIAIMVFGLLDRHIIYSIRDQRLRLETMGKPIAEQRAAFDAFKESGGWRSFNTSGPSMELRVATAGIALIGYYQRMGALPDSLDGLAREGLELEDFYTGQKLVYRRDDASVRVYSVGLDLEDHGGDGRSDVVFQAVLPRGKAATFWLQLE